MKKNRKKNSLLKRLSLVQQLIVVFSLVIILLFFIMMPIVDYNLRSIIDRQMYEKLENEQDMIISGSSIPTRSTTSASHIKYDVKTKSVISTNIRNEKHLDNLFKYLFGDDLNRMAESQNATEKSIYKKKSVIDKVYYYLITNTSDTNYLISVQDSDYSNELISSLRNQTIYIQYIFFVVVELILVVWVLSLIHPLKRIKTYIDEIVERKSSQLNIDREDEIGVVSRALVDMKDNLDKQEKIKEEMIHNISHDLKTPIALIRTYGQSVKDDIYPYGDKESSMDVILENVDRLEHKVKSFLYLNRLDYLNGTEHETSSFEMSQLIRKIVNQMDLLNPDIRLETDLEEVSFIGNEEHWRVAIENIIENASRYAKTRILVKLREGYLEIYNDGEPIDQDILPFLFDPYVKGVKGQSGLGLSIVYKTASIYGYQVKALNREEGVSFIFEKQEEK